MIRIVGLSKRYPGQTEPAVDSMQLEIPRGEICVLVGPSGCGKTTALKLINRLLEPTSGRVLLDGEDISRTDPDRLRRRIGYVIQQIGLFPHQTIARNIGTVPRLLGWDRNRIDHRVNELLTMVGMDPAEFRDRYPKELSGGQMQRVGVARALAGDPPVLLMDEPFGALDPISREQLQNELLRLQEELRKTVVFVTHDIDEAVKLGDRIALMRVGGRIAQYDRPEVILTDPADQFVSDFIGSGAAIKRLNLSRVRDIAIDQVPTAHGDDDPVRVGRTLDGSGHELLLVLDAAGRPRRWISRRDLQRLEGPLGSAGSPVEMSLESDATLHHALDRLLTDSHGRAVVVHEDGTYRGVVDVHTIAKAMRERSDRAHDQG